MVNILILQVENLHQGITILMKHLKKCIQLCIQNQAFQIKIQINSIIMIQGKYTILTTTILTPSQQVKAIKTYQITPIINHTTKMSS